MFSNQKPGVFIRLGTGEKGRDDVCLRTLQSGEAKGRGNQRDRRRPRTPPGVPRAKKTMFILWVRVARVPVVFIVRALVLFDARRVGVRVIYVRKLLIRVHRLYILVA